MAALKTCRANRRSLLFVALVVAAAFVHLSSRSLSFAASPLGAPDARQMSRTSSAFIASKAGSGGLFRQAINEAAKRHGCTATRAVGLFYATQTGNTETVAGKIGEAAGIEAAAIDEYSAEDLTGYDGLIVGCPTWNTGADEYRSGTAWDDLLDDVKGLALAGKPVAIFGCGDSQGYGDNFCDGIEELHDTFAAAGGKMIGYVDSSGYQHSESKSDKNGKFLGLPLDEDNESDLSDERVSSWISQLKSEGMPL